MLERLPKDIRTSQTLQQLGKNTFRDRRREIINENQTKLSITRITAALSVVAALSGVFLRSQNISIDQQLLLGYATTAATLNLAATTWRAVHLSNRIR